MDALTPRIEEVCVGKKQEIQHGGETVFTGIFKYPVANSVTVQWESLQGDEQVDHRFHGGRDKAIYVYPKSQYSFWEAELNQSSLGHSFFGENLTVSGLNDETVCIGDRYKIGSAIVVVSQPRIPCFKLGVRTGDSSLPTRFLQSGWLGFYLRIDQTGVLQQGDSFELIQTDPNGISVRDLWQLTFTEKTSSEMAAKAIAVLPFLDEGWRKRLRAIAGRK
jgi:MOSC domain-containing protein YiiM